jgi:WD40 repeat protein
MDTGKNLKTLRGHTANINDICYDVEGNFLASCSNDLSIKIWDMNKY